LEESKNLEESENNREFGEEFEDREKYSNKKLQESESKRKQVSDTAAILYLLNYNFNLGIF
jgi:hypothetical protein